jgi:hypothetical protein
LAVDFFFKACRFKGILTPKKVNNIALPGGLLFQILCADMVVVRSKIWITRGNR